MARARHNSGTFHTRRTDIVVLINGQSLGWEHYEVHEPEPHILLFK